MAGLYRRFRTAGYSTPKFLLPLGGRTILSHIVFELKPERLVLVANRRDLEHRQRIEDSVRSAGVEASELLFIEDTDGQAITASVGAQKLLDLGWSGPVLFHNVDTILRGRSLPELGKILQRDAGYVDVFQSDSPAYSYVRVDGSQVIEIREKEVISHLATTGLYGFRSPQTYQAALQRTGQGSKGEFYISDVYRTLLEEGARIVIDQGTLQRETLVLGTPQEYEAAIAVREARR
ncbi:MAG: hypothetical protein EA397_20280 [Deltaproteobacteria bacterium]|nr:MAG: hypothetical protein EA397_20280 [Deltaproteobacteria bacterium]